VSDCVSASNHTHTQTCRKFEKYQHDIGAIASALQEEGDCKAWGGRVEAEALKKKMENALPTLKYHVDLLKRQRKNVTFPFSVCSVNDGQLTSVFHCQVKAMEVGLEERGAVLCYLDFGGFYDSEGGKVSCWAITFVTGPELGQSYTVAVFFPGTVSKDADAGYRALSLLLDPAQPSGENVSIFKRLFPDRHTHSERRHRQRLPKLRHVVVVPCSSTMSCDIVGDSPTRRYLSGMKFDLNLELALLPPGHAHNLTDAFFARMNELFDNVKQSSRLVGSHAYAHLLLEGPDSLSVCFPRVPFTVVFTQQRTPP